MEIKHTTQTTTRKEHRVELDREDIIEFLLQYGEFDIPERRVEVFIQIPGGADWSNMTLDINKSHPVVVTWTEKTHDVNED